jgi:hypothetical protein
MYTLKSIARRGTLLGAAFALVASSLLPALPVYADALNPLTDRSLTLSSSAPGWDYLDGSGNATYAPPNSGANGQKVGNTFDFKVSTDSSATGTNVPVKAFSFQYCTNPAGECTSPGNNDNGVGTGTIDLTSASTAVAGTGTAFETELAVGSAIQTAGGNKYRVAAIADDENLTLVSAASATETGVAFDYRDVDGAAKSDLNVVTSSPSPATFGTYVTNVDASQPAPTGNPDGMVSTIPTPATAGSNFLVYYLDDSDDTWKVSPATWAMTASNNEQTDGGIGDDQETGKNNYITLTSATGQGFTSGMRVKIVFFATNTNYITNPGSGAFFVRINTYNSDSSLVDGNVIDGGVTVANVMNLGIQIVTKVLETMDFSVGVVDPYTLQATGSTGSQLHNANGHSVHSVCEPILTGMTPNPANPNRLQLGNENGEFSLATGNTYSTHSYFRLSSNSSAGATVYYSGNTLTNTVGDFINAINDTDGDGDSDNHNAIAPLPGSEQFGIALAVNTADNYKIDYNVEREDDNVFESAVDNLANSIVNGTYGTTDIDSSVTDDGISNIDANPSFHTPRLSPLTPETPYENGRGYINSFYNTAPFSSYTGAPGNAGGTAFAFQPESMTIPVALASNDSQVVDCITGKMRYIANIAATTPAGIYTTKINYIAAPQY